MSNKDSTSNILVVAVVLCLVCSIIVSAAAVALRPEQVRNQMLDQQINILKVSGLWQANKEIDQLFANIEPRLVDISTGEYIDDMDPANYDQRKAARDPEMSSELDESIDVASINRRADIAKVYLVKEQGKVDRYVLPIHGYGLWSTLYGYVTLEKDMNTIYAIKFYDHRETPGLGGEVDNIKWQTSWSGKKVFNDDGEIAINVIKGNVTPGNASEDYQIDGLSGATLTSNGVTNMFEFWMGEHGFKKYIEKIRSGDNV